MPNEQLNVLPPKVILYGGTGQAKVLRPMLEYYGSQVVAVFDDTPNLPPPFLDVELFCGYAQLQHWIQGRNRAKLGFCIAIGNPHGRVRMRLHEQLVTEGLTPVTVVHPTAWVEKTVLLGAGAQILPGAILMAEVRLGRQVIINTKASVDHESVLEDGVELAPGATLCGAVHLGVNAWICAGATVLPRVRIGADAVIGAGAVVLHDVPPATTVTGVPARSRIT